MSHSRQPEPTGFFESLFEALGRVFEDIRHRVVEEGWFGRQVTGDTPKPSQELGWDMPRPSFDEQWRTADRDPAQEQAAPERDGPDLDL